MKLYPGELPDHIHPLTWALFGSGLSMEAADRAARRLFDELGARLEVPKPSTVSMSWAVGWPLDPKDHTPVAVGDEIDELVPGADRCGVRTTGGGLPPGVRLQRWDGRLVGEFTRRGLYEAEFTLGPAIKIDPQGGLGGPDDPVAWIPINQPRTTLPVDELAVPDKVADLDTAELDRLLVVAQQEMRNRAIKEADA